MAGFFDTLFGGGAQEEAAAKNAQALKDYSGTANAALGTGYNTGVSNLTSAVGAYDPLSTLGQKYAPATMMYLNTLGVNGPQGNADATAAFQNNPGYTGAVNAGLDVLNRRRDIQGMGNSGNADIDALTFGQNLQNQQYQNWQTQLAGAGQTGAGLIGQAAQGQAAGYGSLANLGYQYGTDQSGIAGNIASGTVADNNMVAAGQAAGAKNLLGAGLSLATLGLGGNPFGGSLTGGGSSGGSSPFSASPIMKFGSSLFG
jgi:hypothetical protein